jgi:Tfp pilus assembly protein PilW
MKTMQRKTQGFTLTELLIALVLNLFLIGAILLVYGSGRAAVVDTQDLSRIQENMRFASDFLIRDIRNAGFRDEGQLALAAWNTIGSSFVDLSDAGQLTIRYAGRGDCNTQFADIGLVENTYTIQTDVDGTSSLACNGVRLVSGVSAFDVQQVCPDGGNSCTCPGDCIGLTVALELAASPVGGIGPRTIELRAAFRNTIYDSLFPQP